MNCEEFIDALADGQPATEAARKEHAASCEACRAKAARLAEVNELLRNPQKARVDTTGLRERVLAMAEDPAASGAEAPRQRSSRVLVTVAVGVVALGAGFVGGWEVRGTGPLQPHGAGGLGSNHLEAARVLHELGFVDEARVHAWKVVDDKSSTAAEVEKAREYLK